LGVAETTVGAAVSLAGGAGVGGTVLAVEGVPLAVG